MAESAWFYFGCVDVIGHGSHDEKLRRVYDRRFDRYDAQLCPESRAGYVARVTRLPAIGFTALAFWDYTVDARGGSNSAFFAPTLTIEPFEMLEEARKRFPSIFLRCPPISLEPRP
ncbi:hypothetical protein ACFOWB_12715 [Chenggangzhangella methanolivorans]